MTMLDVLNENLRTDLDPTSALARYHDWVPAQRQPQALAKLEGQSCLNSQALHLFGLDVG